VAGATGRLGLRIVRELLLAGFKVRAGARNTDKAQEYADLAVNLGVLSAAVIKRLQIVAVDLEEVDTIVAAIGNAGKVRTHSSSSGLGSRLIPSLRRHLFSTDLYNYQTSAPVYVGACLILPLPAAHLRGVAGLSRQAVLKGLFFGSCH